MPGLLYNPQNIVVGQAVAYYAEVGATIPANTVLYGGDWGTDWISPGATEEGWRLTGESSTTSHNIEEQANPVLTTKETQGFGIAASLAEDTLESVRLSLGGGTITTDAESGVREFNLLEGIEEFAIGLDMQTYAGKTRRIILPRASGAGTVDVAFRRSASKRLWPVMFNMLNKPSELIIRDLPAAVAP